MNPLEALSAVRRRVYAVNPLELPDAAVVRIKDAYASSERSGHSLTDRAHTDHDELMRLGRVHTKVEVVLFSVAKFKRDKIIDISARRAEAV